MRCPDCNSLLIEVPNTYEFTPTPQSIHHCTGCRHKFARYLFPEEAPLLVGLMESEEERIDHLVARKRAARVANPLKCRGCGGLLLPVNVTFLTAVAPKATEQCISCSSRCYHFDVDGHTVLMWSIDKEETESFGEFVERMINRRHTY